MPDTQRPQDSAFRTGFVTFVGRPNVGKSTLMNALLGQKVAITSSKPQTTRHAIRGILTVHEGQIIIIDTPGIHRPRTLLGERLNAVAQATLADVDVIALCFPANESIGPGDTYINQQLDSYPHAKKIAVITKADTANSTLVGDQLAKVSELRNWDAIIPVSASQAFQLQELVSVITSLLPEGPALYGAEAVTDDSQSKRIAELIRESVLEDLQDELPHSLAVTVEDIVDDENTSMVRIYANIFVERDSQKGIIIGAKGTRLKQIGTDSRKQIEQFLNRKVFLDLRVKLAKDWQRDPKKLERLGF